MTQFAPALEKLCKLFQNFRKPAVLLAGGDHRQLVGTKAAVTRFEGAGQCFPGSDAFATMLHDASHCLLQGRLPENAQGLIDSHFGLEKGRKFARQSHPARKRRPS